MSEVSSRMRREFRREKTFPWQTSPVSDSIDEAKALRHAIEAEEIQPYYQPIVDLRTRRVLGFEVLARWISSRGSQIGPAEFIPLAARSGLLSLLTQNLLRAACREASRWPAYLTLAINVAPSQFLDEALPAMVESAVRSKGFPLSRLVVEITEDVLRGAPDKATARTNELRHLGVRLAMDDFGIGESNIRRLGLVDFDIIKIDRSVISSITTEKRTHRGLIAAIAVGHSLGLQVIAEGIEEEWHASIIGSLGCSTIQGWLTGRPMPASDIPSFLVKTNQDRPSNVHAANAIKRWTEPPLSDASTELAASLAKYR